MLFKKTILSPLILFIFFGITSFSQSGKVVYNIEQLNKKSTPIVNKVNGELELMEFTLQYDKEQSFFKKEKNIPKNELNGKLAQIVIGALNDYHQNSIAKTSFTNDEVVGKMYQIDHSYRMKDWELSNTTTEINGYTCYKATLTQYNTRTESNLEIIAWYTPEIPASFGPIGYGGLPGLILQLQYKSFVYKATKVTLNPKTIELGILKKGNIVTSDEIAAIKRANRKVTED